MKTIWMFIMLLGAWAFAEDSKIQNLHLGKRQFVMHEARPRIWVSSHCRKTCDALKAVDRYHSGKKKPDGEAAIGKNPFSWRCVNRAGGLVVVLGDEIGNQESYCLFKDDSMVTTQAFD